MQTPGRRHASPLHVGRSTCIYGVSLAQIPLSPLLEPEEYDLTRAHGTNLREIEKVGTGAGGGVEDRGAMRTTGAGGVAISRGPAPEERPGSRPRWLPGGSGLLHRNPFACQMGCDCCAETRPVAVRPAKTAPGLARLSASSSTKLIRRHWVCGDIGRAGTSAGWSYPPKESRATGQLGMNLFSRLSSRASASTAR